MTTIPTKLGLAMIIVYWMAIASMIIYAQSSSDVPLQTGDPKLNSSFLPRMGFDPRADSSIHNIDSTVLT